MSDERVTSELSRALQVYVEARQAAMNVARRVLGLNELDARALMHIALHPGIRPTQVREYLGITSAGVTTLIDRLVQRGAVRRDLDEVDRRVNHITATVDLDDEPWSALTRFDRDVASAIEGVVGTQADALARVLGGLTASAVDAGR
jgi:DNA-binding MarR family transcriptional regulator